jgi:hypothetical protein
LSLLQNEQHNVSSRAAPGAGTRVFAMPSG